MCRKFVILLFLTCACIKKLQAQVNLVPNHSFEDYIDCPTNIGQIYKCKDWYNPTPGIGTPDYFNGCSSNNVVNIPNNVFGYQLASHGNGYVGIYLWHIDVLPNFFDGREYIGVKLNKKLKANTKYCISFDISLANNTYIAIKNIQVLFSKFPIIESGANNLSNYTPQVKFKSRFFYADTLNWTNLKGTYVANGDEEYITIGNFYKNYETDTLFLDSTIQNTVKAAYYYIDNVWLYECEEDSIPTELPPASDSSLHYKVPNVISPNGDGLNDAFVLESRGVKEASVKVYNRWGEEVVSHKVSGISTDVLNKTTLWDATHRGQPAPQGVYYYIVELSTKNGEVIIEKGTVTVL